MTKTFKYSALALAAVFSLAACKQEAGAAKAASGASAAAASGAAASLGNSTQQASYVMGMGIGQQLKEMKEIGLELDRKLIDQAIEDTLAGKAKLNDQQAGEVMMAFQTELGKKAQAKMEADGKANQQKGDAFLAENGKKQDVKTTASGLQYTIKTEGTGAQPKATDTVTVEYEGRLIDGTVFDSSKQHGMPATFPLNGVIPGWTEGLQLLKEGGEATLFIPAKLAYGSQPQGSKIGPNATLIFDVKLLKIEKGEKAQQQMPQQISPEQLQQIQQQMQQQMPQEQPQAKPEGKK